MTKVKEMVDKIDEEIESAKCYAEDYLAAKAEGDSMNANRFKEMAGDEIKHANYMHDYAVAFIAKLRKIMEPTEAMEEMWNKSHKEYVERVAWIKTMLSM